VVGLGIWDLLPALGVTAQCAAIADLRAPRWKVLVWSLPIPFTLASTAPGEPVNVTHRTYCAECDRLSFRPGGRVGCFSADFYPLDVLGAEG